MYCSGDSYSFHCLALFVQHSMDKFIAFRISDCNLILTILLIKQKLRIPKFVMPVKMDMINGASPF